MTELADPRAATSSAAEDLFVELFAEAFGVEKVQLLSPEHPVQDIYGATRFVDFAKVSTKPPDSSRLQPGFSIEVSTLVHGGLFNPVHPVQIRPLRLHRRRPTRTNCRGKQDRMCTMDRIRARRIGERDIAWQRPNARQRTR